MKYLLNVLAFVFLLQLSSCVKQEMEPELLSPELNDFSIGAKRMGEAAFTLVNPKSKSDGSFIFKTSDTGVVSIKGNLVTIRSNGNCTITAVQLATTTFKRDSIKATFQIGQKIGPVTSVFTLPEKKVGDAPFEIAGPVTNSDGAVSYTSSHPDVASIVGKTLYIKSAGKTVITWSQAESGTYRACTLSAELVVINPPVMENTVTDIDGNVYKTIKIGTQTWMMENLKVTRYRDGAQIRYITKDLATWWNSEGRKYCDYENNPANSAIYGYLYNWEAAQSPNIAPAGWHVPSDAEWQVLYNYIGGRRDDGAKIQQVGNNYWINNNIATNITMFTALPGGQRSESGIFSSLGWDGIWWTSTKAGDQAVCYDLYVKGYLERHERSRNSGFSIRCIKD